MTQSDSHFPIELILPSRLSLPIYEKELTVTVNPDRTINLAILHRTDTEEVTLNREAAGELVRFIARWLRS